MLNRTQFRDTGLTPVVLGCDARILPIFLMIVIIQTYWMLIFCVCCTIFFTVIRYFGFTPGIFFAYIRFSLASATRSWQTKRTLRNR